MKPSFRTSNGFRVPAANPGRTTLSALEENRMKIPVPLRGNVQHGGPGVNPTASTATINNGAGRNGTYPQPTSRVVDLGRQMSVPVNSTNASDSSKAFGHGSGYPSVVNGLMRNPSPAALGQSASGRSLGAQPQPHQPQPFQHYSVHAQSLKKPLLQTQPPQRGEQPKFNQALSPLLTQQLRAAQREQLLRLQFIAQNADQQQMALGNLPAGADWPSFAGQLRQLSQSTRGPMHPKPNLGVTSRILQTTDSSGIAAVATATAATAVAANSHHDVESNRPVGGATTRLLPSNGTVPLVSEELFDFDSFFLLFYIYVYVHICCRNGHIRATSSH